MALQQMLLGSGTNILACDSADFDGINDYMTRGADLTGIVDGKKGICSFWLRRDGATSTQLVVDNVGSTNVQFYLSATDNIMHFYAENAAGTGILDLVTASAIAAGSSTWRHILASWDLGTAGARHLYVDDVSDLTVNTFTDDTINYAGATNWAIGAVTNGANKIDGCLAEFYFNTVDYLDLSVIANRRLFISSSLKPVFMGATGAVPTGTAPVVYFHLDRGEAVADFATNRGSGGDFAITGTLTTGSTSPSD